MKRRKKQSNLRKLRKVVPYILTGALTIALAAVGSLDKHSASISLSMDAFAQNNYKVSVDQLSELYIVADLSDALKLASAGDVASNYVLITSMYNVGQTSDNKLEKPTITDFVIPEKVIKYEVKAGESMDTIAARYGITTDQIRWSNKLKTTAISAGDILYLPSEPGIVYTVKSGDTIASIVEKYGSTTEEILHFNDIEISGITEGMLIFIKNGTLPEKERPEYVPPAPVRTTTYYYSYLGNTSTRQNIIYLGPHYGLGGPYVAGQCTQWAWYKRGGNIPSSFGNASNWANAARAIGWRVDREPSPGAIFQTSSGWYGHVGYVEAVNLDGSILVSEMNYNYSPFVVIQATIPASAVGNFWYIH